MPILAFENEQSKRPIRSEMHCYELSCDRCNFKEHSGPYLPMSDEDQKSLGFAERAMDLRRFNHPGHRVSLYMHVRNVFVETRVSEVRVEGVRT